MTKQPAPRLPDVVKKIIRLKEENLPIDISDYLTQQEHAHLADFYEGETGNEPDSSLEAIDFIIKHY